ncbi:MAG TPA: GxxExxY protein [Saprospiraceae bacterium]|nr:GxxExxY protein [Saprospiraceae bacterium]
MNYANSRRTYEEISAHTIVSDDEQKYYSAKDYPFQKEIYNIIGACMEVHKTLGWGFLESVYHEALCIELTRRNIPFESNKILHVYYKDVQLEKTFKADIFAYDHLMVELKAVYGSLDTHQSQLLNYLSATKQELGLLVNFGMPSLQYKRYIMTKYHKSN